MPKQRKTYSAEFKAPVTIPTIKGQDANNEIASRFDVHPNLVGLWKKRAPEELPGVFSDLRSRDARDDEDLRNQLYQQIASRKVEPDWLRNGWSPGVRR